MTRFLISLLSFLLLANLNFAQEYTLNIEASALKWTGHAAIGNYAPTGALTPKSGVFNLSEGAAEIIIDMQTLTAEDADLENHLRTKDFFQVKKFKTARFTLTDELKIIDQKTTLKGELTIKNQTHPIEVPIKVEEFENGITVSGTLSVNRTKYGIIYNSPNFFENLKDQAIGDVFEIEFHLVFVE